MSALSSQSGNGLGLLGSIICCIGIDRLLRMNVIIDFYCLTRMENSKANCNVYNLKYKERSEILPLVVKFRTCSSLARS